MTALKYITKKEYASFIRSWLKEKQEQETEYCENNHHARITFEDAASVIARRTFELFLDNKMQYIDEDFNLRFDNSDRGIK